jgi:hypothetical protein
MRPLFIAHRGAWTARWKIRRRRSRWRLRRRGHDRVRCPALLGRRAGVFTTGAPGGRRGGICGCRAGSLVGQGAAEEREAIPTLPKCWNGSGEGSLNIESKVTGRWRRARNAPRFRVPRSGPFLVRVEEGVPRRAVARAGTPVRIGDAAPLRVGHRLLPAPRAFLDPPEPPAPGLRVRKIIAAGIALIPRSTTRRSRSAHRSRGRQRLSNKAGRYARRGAPRIVVPRSLLRRGSRSHPTTPPRLRTANVARGLSDLRPAFFPNHILG